MNNTDLQSFINTLGSMFQQSDAAVRPGDGMPPWSGLMNPDTAPDNALGWLAQIVGVSLEIQSTLEDPADYLARQRQRIRDHLGWERGTPTAMEAVIAPLLTGGKTVFFQERDGSAYRVTVITRTAETPDPAAVLRALLTQKPAGIVINFVTATGRTFAETTALGQTFATSQATWPTFNNRRGA